MSHLVIAAIDVGTSVIKTVLVGPNGQELAIAKGKVSLISKKPGWAEQDMVDVARVTKTTIRDVIKRSGISPEQIESVGITGHSAGSVLLDNHDRPLKAMTWRDTRSSILVSKWMKKRGFYKSFYNMSGYPLLPYHATVHLAWLSANQPKIIRRASCCFSCPDWLGYVLTSEKRAVSTSLLGCTDPRTRSLNNAIFELLGVDDCRPLLPPLIEPWEILGEVNARTSKETGLEAGTPVITAGYDQTCNTLGAGAIVDGQAVTILGTGGAHIVVTDKPVFDRNKMIACNPHAVPNRWIAMSEALSATPNLNWFATEIIDGKAGRRLHFGKLDEKVGKAGVGGRGIIYHPFLYGETAPFANFNARAAFFGLAGWHNKYDLLRSIYEGVAYSTRDNYEHLTTHLKEHGTRINIIRLAGGGARSDVWCHILADVINKPIELTNATELGCRGAAICAGVATKRFANFREATERIVKIVKTYKPNRANARTYTDYFKIYKGLYQSVSPHWSELRSLLNHP